LPGCTQEGDAGADPDQLQRIVDHAAREVRTERFQISLLAIRIASNTIADQGGKLPQAEDVCLLAMRKRGKADNTCLGVTGGILVFRVASQGITASTTPLTVPS
jgi:hypothetical protein